MKPPRSLSSWPVVSATCLFIVGRIRRRSALIIDIVYRYHAQIVLRKDVSMPGMTFWTLVCTIFNVSRQSHKPAQPVWLMLRNGAFPVDFHMEMGGCWNAGGPDMISKLVKSLSMAPVHADNPVIQCLA